MRIFDKAAVQTIARNLLDNVTDIAIYRERTLYYDHGAFNIRVIKHNASNVSFVGSGITSEEARPIFEEMDRMSRDADAF